MLDPLDTRSKLKMAASVASVLAGAGALVGISSLSGGVKDEKKWSAPMRPTLLDNPMRDQTQEEAEVEPTEEEEESVTLVDLSEIEKKWSDSNNSTLGCMYLKFSSSEVESKLDMSAKIKNDSYGFTLDTEIYGDSDGDKVTKLKHVISQKIRGQLNVKNESNSRGVKMDDFAVRGRKFSDYMKLKDRKEPREETWIWLGNGSEAEAEEPNGTVEESFLKDVEQWTHENPFRVENKKGSFKKYLKEWYLDRFNKDLKGAWMKGSDVKNCDFIFKS